MQFLRSFAQEGRVVAEDNIRRFFDDVHDGVP
jgi:hypothetical protein